MCCHGASPRRRSRLSCITPCSCNPPSHGVARDSGARCADRAPRESGKRLCSRAFAGTRVATLLHRRKELHVHIEKMIQTHPNKPVVQADQLAACIEACFDCAQACSSCADACIAEANVTALRRCIRLNADCADICIATGQILSRQQNADARLVRSQLETCLLACQVCAEECERHAQHHEHCRVCADACRVCMQACQAVLGAVRAAAPASVKH